jgi:hypothetical protein
MSLLDLASEYTLLVSLAERHASNAMAKSHVNAAPMRRRHVSTVLTAVASVKILSAAAKDHGRALEILSTLRWHYCRRH